MAQRTKNKTAFRAPTIAIYVFLLAGLGTFFLPLVRVKVPPLGEKNLSLHQILKPLLKAVFQEKKEPSAFKIDYDFSDVIMKILPKNESSNKSRMLSAEFILGLLVPVALVAAYLLLLLGLIFNTFGKGGVHIWSSLAATVSAGYAVFGIYFLGAAAQRSFDGAVSKAAEGILGLITRNFVQQIVIEPDYGLYALLSLTVLIFSCNLYRHQMS